MNTTESELEVPDVPSNSGRGCTSAARAAKGHIPRAGVAEVLY